MFGGGIGGPEILLIFLVVLILFGAKRIPDIAQGLGKGIKEFKKAVTDTKKEITNIGDVDKSEPNQIEKKDDEKK